MQQVLKFIVRNRQRLLALVEAYLSDTRSKSDIHQDLAQLSNEWKLIPLEEKQIPYQDGEREFWYAYHSINILTNPEVPKNSEGQVLPVDHPAWIELREQLKMSANFLKGKRPIPKEFHATRILP